VSPLPRRERLAEYALKGVHLGLRQLALAPEQVTARRLAAQSRLIAPDAPGGPRIAFITPRDWAVHVQWEGMLAQALRLRGADVRFVTCGGGLKLCDRVNTYEGPPMPCTTCTRYVHGSIDAHGFPRVALRDGWEADDPGDWPELDELSLAELFDVSADGVPLGRLFEIPLRWFLVKSQIEDEPLAPLTMRRFLRAGRQAARGLARSLDQLQPDVVVALNGLFFFESIALELCRQRAIPAVVYERGFIPGTLLVHQGHPDTLMDIPDEAWMGDDKRLTLDEEAELDRYLEDRRFGRRTMDMYWKRGTRHEMLASESRGRTVAAFTNLTWDSAVLGQELAFPSIHDWLIGAVEWARDNPQHELVVRIHPAEVKLPGKQTREPLAEYLRTRIDPMPANVRILDPDDPTSSYVLMEASDVGLVFSSTVGLELAVFGTPVIVAGRTHYRGKGFTIDVNSQEEFRTALDAAVADPAAHAPDLERARRYAYAFFFRAPMQAPFVEEHVPGLARITIDEVDPLLPGRTPGVDRLCDQVLGAAVVPSSS
jgi:hypothetical protein